MVTDRREKKRKKREQKRKASQRQTGQRKRLERSEEYAFFAHRTYEDGDHRTALTYALKRLKVDPHDLDVLEIALHCASTLQEKRTFYSLLCQAWNKEFLTHPKNCLVLGQLAVQQEHHELAQDVFSRLDQGTIHLDRPLTRAEHRMVASYLDFLEVVTGADPDLETPPKAKASLSSSTAKSQKEPLPDQPLFQFKDATAPPLEPTPASPQPKGGSPGAPHEHPPQECLPEPEIVFKMDGASLLKAIKERRHSDMESLELALQAYKFSFRASYDQLLCLPTLHNVESLGYQEETARKVLKTLRGRAILADEVGLGKTIEAGLVLKEYQMRGLVRSALILTPSSLVAQWREELEDKFNLSFATTNDPLFRQDPERFWKSPFVLASIQTAKSKRQFDAVTARTYDMIIVDEAHHLKNRTTLNWKLVNTVKKTFLLLLTATPVRIPPIRGTGRGSGSF